MLEYIEFKKTPIKFNATIGSRIDLCIREASEFSREHKVIVRLSHNDKFVYIYPNSEMETVWEAWKQMS